MVMDSAEKQLLDNIKEGNKEAFTFLFERYYPLMVENAYARIHDMKASEDLVQEIFVEYWQKKSSIEIKTNIRAYLMTAVKYKIFRYIDRQRLSSPLLAEHESHYFEKGEILAFEELYEQLQIVLEQLPGKVKEVFIMSRFEHLKISEIADKLNIAPQTVNNRMSQALKFLRAELKQYLFIIPLLIECI